MRKFSGKFREINITAIAIGLAMGSAPAVAATPSSLGADGWATVGTNNLGGTGTTGGNGAAAAKTYTVSNRNQLIQALYGNAATINADGSVSGTLDTSKKIIYVSGTISLNMNQALHEMTADDYVTAANTNSTCKSYGYTSFSGWWNAYLNAYKPPYSSVPSGTPESFRVCAANQQKKVVRLTVPSNTSLIGLDATAKITHGNLQLGSSSSSTPGDNIVIRNIAFEDAFDFFPQWDPTDSGGRWNSAYDNVTAQYVTHLWVDHCTFSDGSRTDDMYPSVWAAPYDSALYEVEHHDGLLDVTGIANYVTLSYNHFHDHNKTDLIGSTDTAATGGTNPSVLKTTIHHNYYQNAVQRQPRVRYGMVHVFSNYYTGVKGGAGYGWSYAWGADQGSKLYAENNVFDITGGSVSVGGDIVTASISSSKVSSCASLSGMSTAYCSAYMYDTGSVVNGASVNVSAAAHGLSSLVTVSATPWPSPSNPTATPSATPASYYSYTIGATTGLATSVPANAGVGKL